MLFVVVHAQVLTVQLQHAVTETHGHQTFTVQHAVAQPIREVTARAGVLQAESPHAQEVAAVPGDHTEAPLGSFHVIGHLAFDAQLGLEGSIGVCHLALHIVVAFGEDHAAFARSFHHGLDVLHILVAYCNADVRRLHSPALRMVSHHLRNEGEDAGMPLALQETIGPHGAHEDQCGKSDQYDTAFLPAVSGSVHAAKVVLYSAMASSTIRKASLRPRNFSTFTSFSSSVL